MRASEKMCDIIGLVSERKVILLCFNDLSIFKVLDKWFKPKILAEHGAYMLVGEPGKSILEISIRKNDPCLTGRNQIYITKSSKIAYGDVMT